jgi:hypothetical protein
MSDLGSLNDKQLIDRHRFLADRVLDLKAKMEPLFEEYEKIRVEYLEIDTEIAKRHGLPTVKIEPDN